MLLNLKENTLPVKTETFYPKLCFPSTTYKNSNEFCALALLGQGSYNNKLNDYNQL